MSRPEELNGRCDKHRILVVDEHLINRQALRLLLAAEPSVEVCGEAEDESEALQQIEQYCPDVAVIDVALKGGGGGISLVSTIKERWPSVKTLIWSMFAERLLVERALRAGAAGYLSKEESLDELREAIRRVLRGEVYLSPLMTRIVMDRLSDGKLLGDDLLQKLSRREREIFEMIGRGLTTQQIAVELRVSSKTIDSHRERIKQKLDLKNGTELTHLAIQCMLQGQ
jgi:DNA-binding NarL/FixJ family response regulator